VIEMSMTLLKRCSTVSAAKSVVQLSGFADNRADIDKASDVARTVPGVRSVKNDMRVK